MPPMKFKFRLGNQQHVVVSGTRYVSTHADDSFNCRVTVRCNALQASADSDFTGPQLQSFITSVLHIIRDLRGECELVPHKCGSVSIHVGVTDTGAISTDVKMTKLTSDATAHTGWNTYARFHSQWDGYYNAVSVACLNVPTLRTSGGHIPTIEGIRNGST